MVFYRKYRPQKIDELDNETVRQSLYSIFSKPSSVHAFLLTGPKGLGKTSTARIVAKVINCEHPATSHQKSASSSKGKLNASGLMLNSKVEPDNKCEQCLSITNGNNLDVLEIDGASNRGIDEIRDLREKIKLTPFKAGKKIYIIDEVHMLTTEAFNALLKTLEEPPIHAVFILCTTEYHKVPETIASRCFRINFTRATEEELVRSLQRIIKPEKINIDKDALFEIAKLSDGSFRDGAKILEEVATFANRKKITADLVNEKNNTLGIGQSVKDMMDALISRDIKKGLSICRDLQKQGMDFKFFTQNLIEKLHLILLVKVGVEKGENANISTKDLRKLFELLSEAHNQTKYAVLPQMPLELAVLEWSNNEFGGSVLSQGSHLSDDARRSLSQNKAEPRSLNESLSSNSDKIVTASATTFNSSESGSLPSATPNKASTFLHDLINDIKIQNHLVAALLRSCSVDDIKNATLSIITSSKFHKEKLEEQKTLKIIQDSVDNLSDKKIKINIILKAR